MSKLAMKIDDARVLKLIRRYLEAGMMADGLVTQRREGTPQGGPLSPLLSNILLTALDRELERRGHAFCRYADDCNIYVGSERAGMELLHRLTEFLEQRLKLKVNVAKSAVARPWQRKFLGYSLTAHRKPKLRIAKPSLQKLTEKVKVLLRGARGQSLAATIQTLNPVLRGWAAYFKLAETKRALEERDGWIRRQLRCVLLATMEAVLCACAPSEATRLDGGARMAFGHQRAGSVVECGRESHARGLPQVLVRPSGAGVAARYGAAPPARFMNRRMRNRTYGGVGGRPG
jgi:group II intron reverse transcriptase/maturase